MGEGVDLTRAGRGRGLRPVPVRLSVGGTTASLQRCDGGQPVTARILVVDNYDSFVFNLVQYLYQLGAECEVRRNDEVELAHAQDGFDGVLLSPGPGAPEQAGVCIDMVRHCASTGVPVFGVCLGMQSMAVAYGGVVDRAPELLHGKTSLVTHEGAGVFQGLPSPFTATRYHSLAVERDTVADE